MACTFSTSELPKMLRTGGVLCAFWLRNVLCATTACTFSTSQLPKVLRTRGGLHILTAKSASPHNSVHFFNISTAKSCSELQCFAHFHFDLRFAPQQSAFFDLPYDQVAPEPQNIGKTRRFPTFLDFRATSSSGYWSSFCWPSFYWLFLFSACSHHRCCICPKVGSLTSKLPSVNM